MKSEARALIKNWHVVKKTSGGWGIAGNVYGHPNCGEGDYIRTSRIRTLDLENGIVVTKNSTYELCKQTVEPSEEWEFLNLSKNRTAPVCDHGSSDPTCYACMVGE